VRARPVRSLRQRAARLPGVRESLADHFFYCAMCGSPRVAGVMLRSLNRLPDHRGAMRDLVTQAEIDAVWPEVADPERYFYHCFACGRFGNCIYDAELLAEKFPDLAT